MNQVERKIYDKYAYDETFMYIWRVYSEFERRVNSTLLEYDGLKNGECRFDYDSWEKRLNISHKKMTRAIKELTSIDKVLTQTFKGVKGNSSVYFLNRFELFSKKCEEQKKEQNEEQNEEQNKPSKTQALKVVEEQNKEQNEEQKKVHTSIYNNLYIKSNIYSEVVEYLNKKINSSYKSTTKVTQKLIDARLKDGFTLENFKMVIDIKANDWLNTERSKYLRPQTLFGDKFESYLNQQLTLDLNIPKENNYEDMIQI